MASSVAITEILTPAATLDLVTLADVKIDLGLTTTEDDLFLSRRVAEMSLAARQYMNRTLPVETLRDSFWPQRDPYPWQLPGGVFPLQLSRWPLVAVPSLVTENGTTLVAGADYLADLDRGQLTRIGSLIDPWPRPWSALPIVVEYSAGLSVIPADVSGAVSRAVKAQYFARTRDPAIKSHNVTGVYSASYLIPPHGGGLLSADVCAALDNYRVPVVV